MKVFTLAAGLAAGYILGSRAGREKYEQIVASAHKAQNHPAVTQLQNKAKELLSSVGAASPTGTNTDISSDTTPQPADLSPKARTTRRQPQNSPPISEVATDPLV